LQTASISQMRLGLIQWRSTYIVETAGRRISRTRVHPDGILSDREIFGPPDLGPSGYPDGIAFDSYGNLWGTLIYGEKIFALTPRARVHWKKD
jgi:gluconolactonase